MNEFREKVLKAILPLIQEEGVDCVDITVRRQGRSVMIDVLVDYPQGGIQIDACARINKKCVHWLEEAQVLKEDFTLSVASPGLDRPLVTENDFHRVLNKSVRFVLLGDQGELTECTGSVKEAGADSVLINTVKGQIDINYEKIKKAVQVF